MSLGGKEKGPRRALVFPRSEGARLVSALPVANPAYVTRGIGQADGEKLPVLDKLSMDRQKETPPKRGCVVAGADPGCRTTVSPAACKPNPMAVCGPTSSIGAHQPAHSPHANPTPYCCAGFHRDRALPVLTILAVCPTSHTARSGWRGSGARASTAPASSSHPPRSRFSDAEFEGVFLRQLRCQ